MQLIVPFPLRSAAAIGGLPRPLDHDTHDTVSNPQPLTTALPPPSQPSPNLSPPPPLAQEVVASPSPTKVRSSSKSRPPVRTSPIDPTNSSSSGDENNFSARNYAAATSKPSTSAGRKKKKDRERSQSREQSYGEVRSERRGRSEATKLCEYPRPRNEATSNDVADTSLFATRPPLSLSRL